MTEHICDTIDTNLEALKERDHKQKAHIEALESKNKHLNKDLNIANVGIAFLESVLFVLSMQWAARILLDTPKPPRK